MTNSEGMRLAKNISITLTANLDDWDGVTGPVDQDLRQVVVQKTSINDGKLYAMQRVAGDTLVYRGQNNINAAFNKKYQFYI